MAALDTLVDESEPFPTKLRASGSAPAVACASSLTQGLSTTWCHAKQPGRTAIPPLIQIEFGEIDGLTRGLYILEISVELSVIVRFWCFFFVFSLLFRLGHGRGAPFPAFARDTYRFNAGCCLSQSGRAFGRFDVHPTE